MPRYWRAESGTRCRSCGHAAKSSRWRQRVEWISLYRAALRETDPDKLQARIEEAEQAMRLALRSAVEYEDSDQRHTIGEALRHLETVQQSSKDAGQSGGTPSERQR